MGGEKPVAMQTCMMSLGSPPRGRGKDGESTGIGGADGITPAWAGKSRRTVFAVFRPEDHPRVGGEKHLSGTTDNRPQGSPPHGRGKVEEIVKMANVSRITPAWAGKSSRSSCRLNPDRDHLRVGGEKL